MINNKIELDDDFNKCEELLGKLNEIKAVNDALKYAQKFDDATNGRVLGWDLSGGRYLAKEFNRLIIEYVMKVTDEN